MLRPFTQEMNLLIEKEMLPYLGKKVAYVSPFHRNVGDFLLEQGCRNAISGTQIISQAIFKPGKVSECDVIMVQGGGNFGDLYADARKAWLEIIAHNRKPVVFLPQSVFWNSKKYMDYDLNLLKDRPNVTFMVREKKSLEILKDHVSDLRLVPDFAFMLRHIGISPSPSGEILRVARIGVEKLPGGSGVDWKLSENVGDAFHQAHSLLSGKSYVISDRLHVHILCSIHGIPNTFVSNSYHKNKSFYETWTCRDGVTRFSESWADV